MTLGTIFAVINGVAIPIFALLFGDAADTFSPFNSPDKVIDEVG